MESTINVHGSIFLLLRQFANEYKEGTWDYLLRETGLEEKTYNIHENYPLSDLERMILKASELTGLSEDTLKEKFGKQMVPSLMKMYQNYVDPSWKTFELLEYTELVIHKAVRKEESKANPPVLNVSRVHDNLLIIDYFSKRKMGSLAVGIIKGIAEYYKESDRVKVISLSNPNEERVQIRVEFL
ncbi:MAG: hypothetical protein K0S32_4060 [Bacteroidetes bacterium]|jgi:hypothetical protein|nr:hypothetical protein [Bacteroidota bacterium]